jgi:uncharacterized protein (TIGR02145 family)
MLSFTGTPMYDIVLAHSGVGSVTIKSGDMFLLPCNYTVTSFSDATGAPGIMDCTMPGSTVNFTAFNPCSNAVTGDYWYLTDTREAAYGNTQTYKVKKMADGHIWMVQDMKFGNKCNKASALDGSSGQDLKGNITSLNDMTYYGDCSAATTTSTPPNRGYWYNWAAAINKSGAYYGSSSNVGCGGTGSGTTDTNPGACQGICPVGWHVPTGDPSGEFQALHNASGTCLLSNDACWNSASPWEGVLGGYFPSGSVQLDAQRAHYISSSNNGSAFFHHVFETSRTSPAQGNAGKSSGYLLRCLKNY